MIKSPLLTLFLILPFTPAATAAPPASVSGIYPHLAMYNSERECGTGAVVPWAGRLWVITYASHAPDGSDDKLYEITDSLDQTIRPESVGGTPAGRMIHRESDQLFIGPYAIDAKAKVRPIPQTKMPGRITGYARHLSDPANKVYVATMEEGFYELDVRTLAVKELYKDGNSIRRADGKPDTPGPLLPGYHGKGLYSGQGVLVYANNGEYGPLAQSRPDIESGCLAEWDGKSWRVVRRNQFTDVTGPGDLSGNPNPAMDPIWSIGWDHRSLILMSRDHGAWHTYRVPKSSHSYDGAHGWNTEWPRIRDIGERDLLMTMHGAFWRFPKTFDSTHSAGIAPRTNYLKVIGDFTRWNDKIVAGCDDTARSEFLNKRKAKGPLQGPGQSHSNLWFIEPSQLDRLGQVIGRGAVWLDEQVDADRSSDPYLFDGYDHRTLFLSHGAPDPVTFRLEVDRNGDGKWIPLRDITVAPNELSFTSFDASDRAAWVRLTADRPSPHSSAVFHYTSTDRRSNIVSGEFGALASASDTTALGGTIYALGDNRRVLGVAADRITADGMQPAGYYELGADLKLTRRDAPADAAAVRAAVPLAAGEGISIDAASVLVIDDAGRRWRFPKGDPAATETNLPHRRCREVCTERDLLNLAGAFYELPAENAGGYAKVRPIATHNRLIHDYCSYRGLLVLTGVAADATPSDHLIRSDDGNAAVWVGVVDDLWQLGKPRGQGGPWKDSTVRANTPSDPYLMTGYDRKHLRLRHDSPADIRMTVEVDIAGTGLWKPYRTFDAPPGRDLEHTFPDAFGAYWIRVTADKDCRATAWLTYD